MIVTGKWIRKAKDGWNFKDMFGALLFNQRKSKSVLMLNYAMKAYGGVDV
jgi:hypothetical protein